MSDKQNKSAGENNNAITGGVIETKYTQDDLDSAYLMSFQTAIENKKLKDELTTLQQANAKLEKQNAELVNVLSRIYKWELPETGRFWDDEKTRPISYETEYGSNGARDYIKKLAFDAIKSNKQP